MDPLLEQFLQEARENLAFIEQNIDNIGSDDPELLNSVFRAAHTLKGGSGIVGFDSVKNITHYAEDLLDMLRSHKIDFVSSMTEVLYDAFDEVMNLIEAAEETSGIVEADDETIARIIENLNKQMGKTGLVANIWHVPFMLVEDIQAIVNRPMQAIREVNSLKINFKDTEINEEFCAQEHLYAVIFDVDESCMVYGNDPIYALSLLEEKVLGVYSCITNENAKSILSGIEDEDGLLLRTQIMAFIYAKYENIEDSLFNFIDEIQLLPLDIVTLLSINVGDHGHRLDLLKELSNVIKFHDIASLASNVEKSMGLVGENTLQYAQLQRFLDISSLIKDSDIPHLEKFFSNLYKGEVYRADEEFIGNVTIEEQEPKQKKLEKEFTNQPIHKEVAKTDENVKATLQGIIKQQYKSLSYAQSEDDLKRIIRIIDSMRKYIPDIPSTFHSKSDVSNFLKSQLKIEDLEDVTEDIPSITAEVAHFKEKNETVDFVQEPIDTKTYNQNKESIKEESKKSLVGKTVKIDQESIDSLMNVVGELLVAKNSLPYLAENVISMSHETIKREIMEKYIFINRLSEQLQDLTMGMRMLPMTYVFDRYPKLVRDMAKKLGKNVKLEMDGGETKLDKNMIEMLADPMVHIMRNSLDHGIETPEIREQKGKDATGTIRLRAYAQSDKIIVEIIDDGAGINIQRVANKVLEKGLLTYEQIDALSEEEKAELILLPGLSTVESISEYSGRGVGMDVVKKSVESFGGTINIKTIANKGTTITLAIPVSLAVTSLLHIMMNDIHYGIPMDSVSETVKLEKDEIEYLHNEPFIYIRGEVIPLLFIKSMLNEEIMKNEPLSIVVLNIKDNLLAVVVNKFLGQLDVVQKQLVGIMEGHPLFSGTALLGNGQIIMSIDPLGLLSISQKLKEDIQVA
jgi:two-component system chemotaxis sensor kinase CheA